MNDQKDLKKPLDVVMKHLARNRLGDNFQRKVTSSLDRHRQTMYKKAKSRHNVSIACPNTSLE